MHNLHAEPLVDGQELPLALRHLDTLGRGKRHERVFGNDVIPDSRVQCLFCINMSVLYIFLNAKVSFLVRVARYYGVFLCAVNRVEYPEPKSGMLGVSSFVSRAND